MKVYRDRAGFTVRIGRWACRYSWDRKELLQQRITLVEWLAQLEARG